MSHVRPVHPSMREDEASLARCVCHVDNVDTEAPATECPLHMPAIYAAWHSKHRA